MNRIPVGIFVGRGFSRDIETKMNLVFSPCRVWESTARKVRG